MPNRYNILKDEIFWFRLGSYVTERLKVSENVEWKKYWIDDIFPVSAENSKMGVGVSGDIWLMGTKNCYKFKFKAKIPQKLLHKIINNFEFIIITT